MESTQDSLQVVSDWFCKDEGGVPSSQSPMRYSKLTDDPMQLLQPYVLLGAQETGKEIRRGPFTIDVEVVYKGMRCVGKKVFCNEVDEHFHSRFEKQCSVLRELRHPHIEYFVGLLPLGVSQSPMIVTEFVPYSLTETISRYHSLPEEISYSILHNISLALRYLHERVPPIAHRGLSADSVLVHKDMTAKLSDVGVVEVLHLTQIQMMQRKRAALAYMPPEALESTEQPQHITKIDIFSYGVLALHVFSGNIPMPDQADSSQQSSETDLRKRFLVEMGDNHPLAHLTRQCLSNSPQNRPDAVEIQTKVSELSERFPRTDVSQVELMQQIDDSMQTKMTLLDEIQVLDSSKKHEREELQRKEKMFTELELKCSVEHQRDQLKLQELQADIQSLKGTLQSKEDEIEAGKQSAEEFKRKIEADCEQFVRTREESWKTDLRKREEEHSERLTKATENHKVILQSQQLKLSSTLQENKLHLDAQLQRNELLMQKIQEEKKTSETSHQAELSYKVKELQHKNAELQRKDAEMKRKEANFASEREELKRKYNKEYQEQESDFASQLKQREREYNTKVREKDRLLEDKDTQIREQRQRMQTKHDIKLKEKQTIIEAKDAELSSRDTLIDRKTEILAGLHQQLDQLHSTVIAKSQVHPLNMHASFTWTQCTHLPVAMAHAQAVVVNGELYVGGGETDSDDTNSHLYKYIPSQEKWSEAYVCPVRYFGLGKLSQQPVLVGGVDKETKHVSNALFVYDDTSSLKPFIPMSTARSHPCVISYQSGLIVAGGYSERTPLTTVELFKADTQQWYKADPLPTPCAMLSSATIDDMCYLMGGEKPNVIGKNDTVATRLVLCALVTDLLKKAIPTDQTSKPDPKTSIWKPMENAIHRHSAAVKLGGMLLAVAGDNSTILAKDTKQAIYAYCPTRKNWVHIADVPEPCTMCTAVALPSQEIVILGGKDNSLKFSRAMYKGSIQT